MEIGINFPELNKISEIISLQREEESGRIFVSKNESRESGIQNKNSEGREIIQTSIFVAFFLSLLILGAVILKKNFKRHKRIKTTKTQGRQRTKKWNVKNPSSVSGKPVESRISILNCDSELVRSKSLDYYYTEPRRILWQSIYGDNCMGENSSAFPPASLLIQVHLNVQEKEEVAIKVEAEESPPNYEDVFVISKELPSYTQALSNN